MKEKLKTMFIKAIIFYCVLMAAMYVLQRKLMYLPSNNLQAPAAYGLHADAVSFNTSDGVKLTAWQMAASKGSPTIVHLHGNAGNIADRGMVYKAYNEAGFGVLALSWRGYGTSEGSPSEQGFYNDARGAIAHLKEQGLSESDIILYGESIGTGTAVQMATEINARALILEAPFTSLWERAAEIYFWLPVKYLIKDRYDSRNKIDQVAEPILIFHNEHDKIVPSHHGKEMFEIANEPKHIELFDSGEHVSFDRELLAQKIKEFLQAH